MKSKNPKEAREYLGLNQTQMASTMGVHRNLWLKWEREEQRITAAPLRLIEVLLWLKSKNMLVDYLDHF